jgi:uncharacterized protein (TIGR00730 family)
MKGSRSQGKTAKAMCVFCGSKNGFDPEIAKLTREIGRMIAKNGIDLVCGGSDCGLMGAIVDGVLDEGGKSTGVFPKILEKSESPHHGLTKLIRTRTLFTRKQRMLSASDAFLILPGGYGTMDEIFEIIVLKRLRASNKPIILFNYNGFWDYTLRQIDRMIAEGFVEREGRGHFTIVENIAQLESVIGESML